MSAWLLSSTTCSPLRRNSSPSALLTRVTCISLMRTAPGSVRLKGWMATVLTPEKSYWLSWSVTASSGVVQAVTSAASVSAARVRRARCVIGMVPVVSLRHYSHSRRVNLQSGALGWTGALSPTAGIAGQG